MDDPDNKFKVTITWCWEDILSLEGCEDWSESKCKTALMIIKRQLEEFSVQKGYELIENLLNTYSDEIEKATK